MNDEKHELVQVATRPGLALANQPDPGDEPKPGLVETIGRHLRGRVLWAIVLALLFAMLMGYTGFRFGQKVYTSAGLIRVMPVLPVVLKPTDEKGLLPMYDSFVEAQVKFIQSQRVAEAAVEDPKWKALGRLRGDAAITEFMKQLKAVRAGEIISVEFTDRDPQAAMVAVQAVITAYRKLYLENDAQNGEKRLELLEKERQRLDGDLIKFRKAINELAKPYATDDLLPLYTAQVNEIESLKRTMDDAKTMLAFRQPAPTTQPVRQMSREEIALEDPVMADLLAKEDVAIGSIQLLAKRYGEGHDVMVKARDDLDKVRRLIAQREAAWNARQRTAIHPGASMPQVSVEEIKSRLESSRAAMDEAQKKLERIGRDRLDIKDLSDSLANVKSRLDEYSKRIEQLTLESALAARINVISDGDRPLEARRDTRIPFGVAGAVGGGLLGVGIVVLISVLSRKLRYPEDAPGHLGSHLMLGVLPALPEDLSNPERTALVTHCIHRIRTMLQIWSGYDGTKVFAVTSPVAGTGKTSLTMALGISFASANSRTLLIDCDITGGGLTARTNASLRRKLGRILCKRKLITEEQLQEGLRLATASGRPLGTVLVELGYIDTAKLTAALGAQEETRVGLADVMEGERLEDCVADCGVPNLAVLPLGAIESRQAGRVSPRALRRVVEEARKAFDTVLIDTGPFMGSLEAATAASVADGVILTVSRGDQRAVAEQCVRQLNAVGAQIAGVVFNRANEQDVLRWGSSQYSGSLRTSSTVPTEGSAPENGRNMGPVARAMAESMQPERDKGPEEGSN